MFSFLYILVKYILRYTSSVKEDKDDVNSIIARIENVYEKTSESQKTECLAIDSCERKTGSVTFIATNYVLIENRYVCDIANVLAIGLKVGDKVSYLALKSDNEEHKVRQIISVLDDDDESWDNEVSVPQTNVKPQTLKKSVIGKVTHRENRWVIIEPDSISIDLNKVQSDFIPVIGDWLTIESTVNLNEISPDLSNEIVKIDRIQPLRSKLDVGVVSSYDASKEFGTIGKSIVFSKRTCDPGYIPSVGDKVVSDNIESDQGLYTWRSLTVVPIKEVSEKQSPLPTLSSSGVSKKRLSELTKDKCGIRISSDLNLNLNVHEEKTVTVAIRNVGDATCVLRKSVFMIKKAESQLILLHPTADATAVLNPGDSLSYRFKCKARFIGISEELFIFDFAGFQIGRVFTITVNPKCTGKTAVQNGTAISNKQQNLADLSQWDQMIYIPGIRPYQTPQFIKKRNIVFRVPQHYWDLILQGINEGKSQTEFQQDLENAVPCLLNRLSFKSYKDRFRALLYLEEIADTINMQQYNMESAIMRRSGDYLVMQVPGLAEKRPSLLVGDRAIISFKWDNQGGKPKYEGYIHKVTNTEIFLKFNTNFHQEYNSEDCQVAFKCSHSGIHRCHNAINTAVIRHSDNFLFPTYVAEREPQLNLEEIETRNEPVRAQSRRLRTSSISSESSCTSTASISNTSSNSLTKSCSRTSVVERLFNIKPSGERAELASEAATATESNQHGKNLLRDPICNGNNSVDSSLMRNSNTAPSCSDDVKLEPYVSQMKKRKLIWFNEKLNYYQKEAVRNILKGVARPLPYVIFGPPGTGKTITLCEAVLQILITIPESRILIATPSNNSANLVAERLLDSGILKPGDMVRLVAHHCLAGNSIPDKLLTYCATAHIATEGRNEKPNYSGAGPKMNCPMSVLGRHRITIGTCIAVGVMHNMGFPPGHFSHVLVDEAGQATEPEIMIPLNFIHSESGQVVLAGDPLQLGPVVQSRLAKHFGLDESFLSRILRHFPYQRDPDGFETQYDPRLVTKLLKNYRSLPEILELSSSLFYDSELQAQISSKKSEEAKLLKALATEFPEREGSPAAIIFHGVNGENCKDSDCPSWYNPEEATQAYLYLLKLYKCGLTADDIGIITPYQKQVLQIRDLLQELDVELPKISSVEGFQGQERKVIIISTVRSSNSFLNEDIRHSLGFVACPRRLNVAITRARALLIILGNPRLLAHDPYWRSVLIYCFTQGAYTGCTFVSSDVNDCQEEVE